jgi:hypothetical protein
MPDGKITLLPGGLTRTGTVTIDGFGEVTVNESCISHRGKSAMGPCILREVFLDTSGNYGFKLEPEQANRKVSSPSAWPAMRVGLVKMALLDRPARKRSKGKTKAQTAWDSRRQAFYDALTKHAERLVANRLIEAFALEQERAALDQGQLAHEILAELLHLKPGTDIGFEYDRVVEAVESAAFLQLFTGKFQGRQLSQVEDVSADNKSGRAEDIVCHFTDGSQLPVSIKTDKSGKIALSGYGQTSLPSMAVPCYGYDEEELERVAREQMDMALDDAESDADTRAMLLKLVLIERLGLEDVDIDVGKGTSDFTNARVTDGDGARQLFNAVAQGLLGKNRAEILVINRTSGDVAWSKAPVLTLSEMTEDTIEKIRFVASTGRTIGFKFDDKYMFEHQVHSGRGGVKTRAYAS